MATSSATWRRLHRIAHRDLWRAREAGWRTQNILARDHRGFFNRYDYARLWVAQKGKCGLCDKPLSAGRMEWVSGFGEVGTGRGINVDHDHSTHAARSLLHGRCNRFVSTMTAKEALLVLAYLTKHADPLA